MKLYSLVKGLAEIKGVQAARTLEFLVARSLKALWQTHIIQS